MTLHRSSAEEIRKDAGYKGVRILISGELAKARCKTQIDIGFGDVVTPGPVDATYPVLLADLPAPLLRTYPVYTVVAEKLHAIAVMGMTNSRMKDYFDLSVLMDRETLNIDLLGRAIRATFERRGMSVPADMPIGLTDEFAHDASRQALVAFVSVRPVGCRVRRRAGTFRSAGELVRAGLAAQRHRDSNSMYG